LVQPARLPPGANPRPDQYRSICHAGI
jgi:hypothetical protein